MNVAVRKTAKQISRPLKVLVPLIKDELAAGTEAGLEHYRRAGEMLLEAKEQVSGGRWSTWLTDNFELSRRTANRYMDWARRVEANPDMGARAHSLRSAMGETHPRLGAWGPIRDAVGRVKVDRFAEERQAREDELKLHRELALRLIDLGYRAMATRLHPDRGGSRDAMSRLNTVRDELKSFAGTRRFV